MPKTQHLLPFGRKQAGRQNAAIACVLSLAKIGFRTAAAAFDRERKLSGPKKKKTETKQKSETERERAVRPKRRKNRGKARSDQQREGSEGHARG